MTTTSVTVPTTATTIHKRKRPRQRERLPKEGRSSKRTIKKRTAYRNNRHKHRHIQTDNNNTHTNTITNHDNFNSHDTTDLNNITNNRNDDALVILAKQTTLTETQKNVLRKGLKFIPKPKQLPIQTLHSDIRNFMHRLKTIYELKTTSRK